VAPLEPPLPVPWPFEPPQPDTSKTAVKAASRPKVFVSRVTQIIVSLRQ
jgi:hypothetical protein